MFKLKFAKEFWDKYFKKIDKSEQKKLWKQIEKIKTTEKVKHLKYGLPYFVLESGQYRICFEEKDKDRIIVFVGKHKEYEKWIK